MTAATRHSPGDIIAFTPACAKNHAPPPVYKLRAPGLLQQARYDRDIIAAGAAYPDPAAMRAAMRQAIETDLPADRRAEAQATVARFESISRGELAGAAALEAWSAHRALEAELARLSPAYAVHAAQASFWLRVARLMAVRHLLADWDHAGDQPPRLADEPLDEAALRDIPADEFDELGDRAMDLFSAVQPRSRALPAPPADDTGAASDDANGVRAGEA